MSALRRFLDNHVLANLSFALVLVLGTLSFLQMPRARDPEINFNWINIVTAMPGASARDVERRVTEPLEEAIERTVRDLRFVSSTSREGMSTILVRFNQIDERTFDKRIIDLRREVQNTYSDELPEEIETPPMVMELTTSNAFPTASVVVTGPGGGENLRRQARNAKKDLERLAGVDRVSALGLHEPELHVAFRPERLEGLGVTPADLADTVRGYFRDVSAGDLETGDGQWVVRLEGTDDDPARLARLPVTTAQGVVELGALAAITASTEEAREIARHQGEPAVLLAVMKDRGANVLEIVERISAYLERRNALTLDTGVQLLLVDDQTTPTRRALGLMQTNAAIGFALVLLVTWLFLGSRIALLTSIGIPFTLAGTMIVLNVMGLSLNNSVLLGVVIAVGMIVDDAVVVVESIYLRLRQGMDPLDAAIDSLREVFAPVTTSVLTTIAAFLPLMLLPGILGEFMKVIPIVVCVALAISLLEAYWMLPSHVSAARVDLRRPTRSQPYRDAATRWIRRNYVRVLLRVLRHPRLSVVLVLALFLGSIAAVASGRVRVNFFEADPLRIFYVSVEMPPGSTLEQTARVVEGVDHRSRAVLREGELRGSVAYAGQMFTDTEPLFGDTVGQVQVSLLPRRRGGRGGDEIAGAVETAARRDAGDASVSLLRMSDGPPTTRAINIKVRGDEFREIEAAAEALLVFLAEMPAVSNLATDYREGNPELVLRHDGEAIQRAGLDPQVVNRSLLALVDGEIVTTFQDQGEEVRVRVLPARARVPDVDAVLRETLALGDGRAVPLGGLVVAERGRGQQNIRHYNFRRSITVEADVDKRAVNVVAANRAVADHWETIRAAHPNVELDFSGELDDIEESLDAIRLLFLLGVGLIYAILGTQFRSYWQPLMVITTIPLAFTGVVVGLAVTRNPMSLYTLYGTVALAGISVNAAIVLISAANDRLASGMSLLHATVFAARRRVVPILITSLTTIAGLFSLAAGLAGRSLVWGPVATAIVWGLSVSTLLTLIVIPLLYRLSMTRVARGPGQAAPASRPT